MKSVEIFRDVKMSNPSARSRCTWRPRWRLAILGLASMAWLVMGRVDLAAAQPRTVAPIYWQQRLFFIPYQINRHDQSLRAVAKVQLLISRDGISDWRVLEQAEPNVQGFSYHAPEDGEYWFALRHLDQRGQPWPRDLSLPNTKSGQNTRDLSVLNSKSRQNTRTAVQPQLRIMVDTHLPELELSGALNATGAVVVRYEARDASLRPETLVIEVRPAGGTWLPLNPGPPDVSHADRLVGRVEWNAPFGAGTVEVRGSIADGAGHRAQASAQVTLSGPSLRMPGAAIAPAPARGNRADDRGGPSQHTLSVDSFRSTTSTPAQDWPAANRLPPKSIASNEAVNLFAGPRLPAPPPIRNPYSTSAPASSSRRTPARLIGEGTIDLTPMYRPAPVSQMPGPFD